MKQNKNVKYNNIVKYYFISLISTPMLLFCTFPLRFKATNFNYGSKFTWNVPCDSFIYETL